MLIPYCTIDNNEVYIDYDRFFHVRDFNEEGYSYKALPLNEQYKLPKTVTYNVHYNNIEYEITLSSFTDSVFLKNIQTNQLIELDRFELAFEIINAYQRYNISANMLKDIFN